ncbi:putative sulfate exporter family transporter [Jonesiaceae bacterium BS-20]|uniref:Sulfate exporter family transporter n=1 Tax=Jonesiaceae bacterium BS-20 TaxID=3120821 RepID=A0AAU7DVB8_9MICO
MLTTVNSSRATAPLTPGILAAVTLGVSALVLGKWLPVVGGPVFAVLLGAGIVLGFGRCAGLQPGLKFASKWFLQIAVVLLGAKLSLKDISQIGLSSLPILIGTLGVCFLGGRFIGKALKIDDNTRTLITVGTGICGASAIATVAPVIAATAAQVSYAMSTIFLFNIGAVLLFPVLGNLLNLSDFDFGLFAGTAVNDTSSVVAAAATFSVAAMNYAVVVKLVRTLAIIPVAVTLGIKHAQVTYKPWYLRIFQYVPWFLIGFILLALLNSVAPLPPSAAEPITFLATMLITVALAAIALSTDIQAIKQAGFRPLILGAVLWALLIVTSLALLWLF